MRTPGNSPEVYPFEINEFSFPTLTAATYWEVLAACSLATPGFLDKRGRAPRHATPQTLHAAAGILAARPDEVMELANHLHDHEPLALPEVAAEFEVSTVTVHSWVRRGQLAPVNLGGKPQLFERADVEKCINSGPRVRGALSGKSNVSHENEAWKAGRDARLAAYVAAHGELPQH